MAGWTNRGKKNVLAFLRGGTISGMFLALVKSTPTADTNIFSDLTEIATGNGYTAGGMAVVLDATDFDTLTEDDGTDEAFVQLKDFTWTASGGTIPSDGNGATYAVLLGPHATPGSREVFAFGSLGGAKVSATNGTFTIQNFELKLTE